MCTSDDKSIVVNSLENRRKFDEFLEKYGHLYPKHFYEDIKHYAFSSVFQSDSVLTQIYSYIGAISEENDIYKASVKLLFDEFGVDRSFVELGAGMFPNRAIYIDEEQQRCGVGSITTYDRTTVVSKYGNIDIHQHNLSAYSKTFFKTGSVLITHDAHDGIMHAVDIACKEGIEYMITPCRGIYAYDGCDEDNSMGFTHFCSDEEVESYHRYLYSRLEKVKPDGYHLSKVYPYKNFGNNNPTFICKR